MALELPITAYKRVPWGGASGDGDLWIQSVDWSAGTPKMELREEPGGTGTALVTLNAAAAGSQGISLSYDATYVSPTTGAVVGGTRLRCQIDEATIEALLTPADPAEDLVLYYDIHITPPTLPKMVAASGTFTIKPGVTV